jgi:hypothetical protein
MKNNLTTGGQSNEKKKYTNKQILSLGRSELYERGLCTIKRTSHQLRDFRAVVQPVPIQQ